MPSRLLKIILILLLTTRRPSSINRITIINKKNISTSCLIYKLNYKNIFDEFALSFIKNLYISILVISISIKIMIKTIIKLRSLKILPKLFSKVALI